MTAEIAIMNKEAIALAADSAVTMTVESGQKIFTSANKLFALSKYHPVGIMVYGNAVFMGIPWETIIKTYRSRVGKKKFSTLTEYVNDFIKFMDNGNSLFPITMQEEHTRNTIYSYYRFIKKGIIKKVDVVKNEKGAITASETEQIVSEEIKTHCENWKRTKSIPSIPRSFNETIIRKYGKIINVAISEVFENLPISKTQRGQLKQIAGSLFSKFPEAFKRENISGVVIAGFGFKDTFPALESFILDGIANNRLQYKTGVSQKIDFDTISSIIPFAQSEMVNIFMEGVDPNYRITGDSYLLKLLSDYAGIVVDSIGCQKDQEKNKLKEKLTKIGREILKDHIKKLEELRKERYINPVTTVVSMLPKDELAAMAESLVNLTSFKRKVTMESETVGGPIDVVVISKGDGFIWIKRKHYFKTELNPNFFACYYMEV